MAVLLGLYRAIPVTLLVAIMAFAHAADWVVDNDYGPPRYKETGSLTSSTSTGYQGGTYRYMVLPGTASSATWTPDLPTTRVYSLYAAYRDGTNRTTSAPLTVTHTSGTTTLYMSQYGTGTMTETYLGDFAFNAGTGGSVRMTNTGAAGVYIADAMIWRTPVDPSPSITSVTRSRIIPTASDTVVVTATITDNTAVTSAALTYRIVPSGTSTTLQAYDDGAHGDGAPAIMSMARRFPPCRTTPA